MGHKCGKYSDYAIRHSYTQVEANGSSHCIAFQVCEAYCRRCSLAGRCKAPGAISLQTPANRRSKTCRTPAQGEPHEWMISARTGNASSCSRQGADNDDLAVYAYTWRLRHRREVAISSLITLYVDAAYTQPSDVESPWESPGIVIPHRPITPTRKIHLPRHIGAPMERSVYRPHTQRCTVC